MNALATTIDSNDVLAARVKLQDLDARLERLRQDLSQPLTQPVAETLRRQERGVAKRKRPRSVSDVG